MGYLRLENISKNFGKKQALQDINLEVDKGTFCVFLGPSGCGKSTLLNVIAGLEAPDRGGVFLGEDEITGMPPHKRNMAMVFQNYALYPHLNVYENMAFGLRARGFKGKDIEGRIQEAAGVLDIGGMLDNFPKQLSGGERQRVATGRAIVRDPNLFLFDEPLSNLDARLRLELRKEFLRIHRKLGKTSLYVTHDQSEALSLGDLIIVLKNGRVQQISGPRRLYDDPRNLFVAGFIGTPSMNIIELSPREGEDGIDLVRKGFSFSPPRRIRNRINEDRPDNIFLGIRPSSIIRDGEGEEGYSFEAEVLFSELLGEDVLVYLKLAGDLEIKATFHRYSWDDEKKKVKIVLRPEKMYFFDGEGERL